MAPCSEDSINDYARFRERTQHYHRETTPQPDHNEGAESTLAGVGGRFRSRRESYPRDLEFSEGEDTVGQPGSSSQAEPGVYASDTVPRGPTLGSLPTTPTPSRSHYGMHIQTFGLPLPPQDPALRHRRRRRRSEGNRSLSTENTFAGRPPHSNTTVDGSDDDDNGERGRSTTPTPDFPPPRTPSQHSQETAEESVEGQNEGREPVSPHPYSAYYLYDRDRANTEISGFEQRYRG